VRWLAHALAAVAVPACAAPTVAEPLRRLTDADLVAYAARPADPAVTPGERVVLGLLHGLPVVVEFACGDACPAGATRIIRYEIGPGPACAAAGGATVTRDEPFAGGEAEAQFCVPKVLAGRRERR
jgi:hypothetical protein